MELISVAGHLSNITIGAQQAGTLGASTMLTSAVTTIGCGVLAGVVAYGAYRGFTYLNNRYGYRNIYIPNGTNDYTNMVTFLQSNQVQDELATSDAIIENGHYMPTTDGQWIWTNKYGYLWIERLADSSGYQVSVTTNWFCNNSEKLTRFITDNIQRKRND